MRSIIIKIIGIAACFIFASTLYAGIATNDPTKGFSAASQPSRPFDKRTALDTPDASWGEINKPYPSAAWFGNFALRGGTVQHPDAEVGMQPMFPTPYTIKNMGNGLAFGVSGPSLAKDGEGVFAQIYAFTPQMRFATDETGNFKRAITDASDLSATFRYSLNQNSYVSFPVVRGAPYITAFYHNLTPALIPGAGVQSVNGQPPANPINGTRFQIVLGLDATNTQTWILYSEKPITLTWKNTNTGWQLVCQAPYTGWLRIALLEDTKLDTHNDASVLDNFAHTIPISGDVQITDRDTITFKWKTENNQAPLMMSLPHQRELFQSGTPLSDKVTFRVTQGEMQAVPGKSSWVMNFTLPTVRFLEMTDNEVAKLPADRKQAIIDAIKSDGANVATDTAIPDGPYASGKRFARAARLALLANQFSSVDKSLIATRTNILDGLTKSLTAWVKGENKIEVCLAVNPNNPAECKKKELVSNALVYDTTWGGVIPSVDDYGSQIYNDHHFHYGYFVYTYAVLSELGKYDNRVALWLKTPITTAAGGSITPATWISTLIRDYANPVSNDPYFPFARHIDFFNGHSYASGFDAAADGRNQESVSEAINAYYGMALLGDAENDKELAQWGKLLLTQELRAAHTYWQVGKNNTIYAPEYVSNNRVATIIFDGKVDAHTFFGANKEFIYGIQMMPFNGFTSLLLTKPWINEVYSNLSAINLPNTNSWKWILLKGRIMGAPSNDAAKSMWTQAVESPSNFYDNGDSKANTLYLITTQSLSK